MKKRTKCFAVCAIVLVLTVGWIWRFTTLNAYYRALSDREGKRIYAMEEDVPFETDRLTSTAQAEGYYLQVNSFQIVDYDTYIASEQLTIVDIRKKPEKLALVSITLRCEASDTQELMLTDLCLHGVDNYASMNWEVLTAANPILEGGYGVCLSQGEECSIIIPFDLYATYFASDTWRNLDEYDFYLHLTSYPVEKDVKLNVA